jgi:hypothetical protein
MPTSRPEQLRFIRENNTKVTLYSFPAKPLPHSIQMIFHKYDYSKYAASAIYQTQIPLRPGVVLNPNLGLIRRKNSVQQASTGSLELPFPRTLLDATGVQVMSFERDFAYERLASGIASLSNMSGDDILSSLGGVLANIRAGGAAVVKDGPISAATEAVQKLFGDVNKDTAKSVASYLAKKYLSGDLSKIVGAVSFLQYPSVVELSLLGVQEAHFMRFKRAMIDNVSVDYTGGGNQVSIIKGGVPASVTLSISFKELTIQTAEDYGAKPLPPAATDAVQPKASSSLAQTLGGTGAVRSL